MSSCLFIYFYCIHEHLHLKQKKKPGLIRSRKFDGINLYSGFQFISFYILS